MTPPRGICLSLWLGTAALLVAQPLREGARAAEPSSPQQMVVVEYSDFQCEPCAEVRALLKKLVDVRKVPTQVIFKHAPSKPEALVAHEAAIAAGKQGKFWEMHDLLFKNPKANYSEILEMARSLGLDVDRFQNSLDEREFRQKVLDDLTESRGIGIRVTPTLFINGTKLEGIEQLRQLVDYSPKPNGHELDPNKEYSFELEGSPVTGTEDASITIVEFSDFRCGFCGIHSRNVTKLMEEFPGKIRRIYKHFPIEMNENGILPSQGAMAAMSQGRFWDMHRALMNQPLKNRDDLVSRAVAIGLDMGRFEADLASDEFVQRIRRDVAEGEAIGIRMTPSTFINGKALVGRQTLRSLRKEVSAVLGIKVPDDGSESLVVIPALGPDDALVSIEFFCDYSDPRSRSIGEVLDQFLKETPQARLELRPYFEGEDPAGLAVHEVAAASAAQGKFWEFHKLLMSVAGLPSQGQVREFALRLGLDIEQIAADLADQIHRPLLQANKELAKDYGLTGQAVLVVNGKPLKGLPTARELTIAYDEECCARRGDGSTDEEPAEIHDFEDPES